MTIHKIRTEAEYTLAHLLLQIGIEPLFRVELWAVAGQVSALVRPRRAVALAVSADGEGLPIGGARVAWRDVRRLDAYKRDINVGDFLCLTILAAGGRVFEINEESPGWQEVGDMIEQFLPGSLPYAEWTLRLFAAKPGQSVVIYHVTAEK